MAWLITGAMGVAAALFVALSATMNALFLSSLGRTPAETLVLAAVSLAADLAKAMLPVVVLRASSLRAWVHALAAMIMLLCAIALSLSSGIGFAALARGQRAVEHQAGADAVASKVRELADLDARLAALSPARAPTVLDAELARLAIDRRWAATKACTIVEGSTARTFCDSVLALKAERAVADEHVRLTAARADTAQQFVTVREQAQGTTDDQTRAIGEALGLDVSTARRVLTLFLAVVIELGSVVLVLLLAGPALVGWREPGEVPTPPPVPAALPASRDVTRWQRARSSLTKD